MISQDIKNLIQITESIIRDYVNDKLDKPVDLASDIITKPTNFIAEKIKDNKKKTTLGAVALATALSPGFRHNTAAVAKGTYNFFKRGFGYG